MACRGIFYAFAEEDSLQLLNAKSNEELLQRLNDLSEVLDEDNTQYVDKAWDGMHRCLSDGSLEADAGAYPLNRCVLGGTNLYDSEDHIVCFVPPADVQNVAREIAAIDRPLLHALYTRKVFPDYQYGEKDENDFEYTWEYFEKVVSFYQRASAANRAVIF